MADPSSPDASGEPRSGRIGIGLALDSVHFKILDVLRTQGRISVAALAERVGVSRANAYTRLEALRADGVISGFSARVDHGRVGLEICALIFVTVRQELWKQFRTALAQLPEVEYCAVTTGQHDAMIQVRVRDVAAVHRLVTDQLSTIPAVRATETVIILDEVLRRPYVLPSAPGATEPTPTTPQGAPGTSQFGMTRFIRAAEGRADLQRVSEPED
ncbi:Lrp/AsnC family transcriptional regulator [Streptomyces sp. SID12501]|uniref:Lrp/AsnC family transcriptional regulator n=1 Tax=Streptomyces sp. SID12501 TaxID=2706042 RepID=A0A6B3BLA4_9ACTN|nr:Lrp/AsnC family transcriptional regulator [Streptomyces sp. SID12501]NEC84902.1 Lrp/AsnC family transcriptional regulator [Streptomyces sp. SID12501]